MYNILVGQSGGPTAVINASLYGVVQEAIDNDKVDTVYGMVNGIEGFLRNRVINMSDYAKGHDISLLKTTPASFLGSCRFKLPENLEDAVYPAIMDKLKEYEIKAFFYIGGNDSMDTVSKLSRYAAKVGEDICFVGVPKTIDNDLIMTDHTPGFGSTAKYVAATVKEIVLDAGVYEHPVVTIVELMGRNAGWVTAASVLARTDYDRNPLLVYLPESDFDVDTFVNDVKEALKQQSSVVVCVSEGISDKSGKFICEYGADAGVDNFGHKMLTGCGKVLEGIIKERIGCKCRSIEINLPQRCSAILASQTDINEAEGAGRHGVRAALASQTGIMITFERAEDEYAISYGTEDVNKICNREKKFPAEWITAHGTDIADAFLTYVTPLIQGESAVPFENGMPKYLKPAYKEIVS